LASLKVNPVSVMVRVSPISLLFNDKGVRRSVLKALGNYLDGEDAFDYSQLSIFD